MEELLTSLEQNSNFIMNGWGQYFITFMQTVRYIIKSISWNL